MYPNFVRENERQNFDLLIAAYKQQQLIPYVGAGFSMAAEGCPSWGGFLQTLFDDNKTEMEPDEITKFEQHFDLSEYELALDVLVNVIGKGKFYRQVELNFDKPKQSEQPIEFAAKFDNKFALFHKVFAGPWLTTNLDRLIEHSFPRSNASLTVIEGYKDSRLNDDFNRDDLNGYLFKLHGDAKSRQSLVFAREQYSAAYGDKDRFDLSAKLPQVLERIYQNSSLLFIGCSLSIDRPMMILEHLVAAGGVKPQFALLRRRDFAGEQGRANRRRLNHLDITPIYLDDFTDIEQVFTALLATSKTTANPPIADNELENPDVFVGRESQLATLIQQVQRARAVVTITENKPVLNPLIGHGGIGKTTLARKVLLECGDLFDGCFEIRIDSITVSAFAKELAAKLGITGVEFNNDADAKAYINQQLNQHKLLLLLDNVDSGAVLLDLLPKQYQSCIIVTSRDNELYKLLKLKRQQLAVSAIELEKFNQQEALALFDQILIEQYCRTDEPTYLAIAQAVDYLPIALRLAITTMVFGNQLSANELLDQLKQNRYLLLSEQASALDINQEERSILAVFDLSTPLLTDELNYGLALMAVCEQGPVPEDFLQALNKTVNERHKINGIYSFFSTLFSLFKRKDIKNDDDEVIGSLQKLARYSWCKRITIDNHHYYELHQIVRHVITEELIKGKFQALELEVQFVNTMQQHFILKPQHFTVLDRWINQSDKALMWLSQQQDRRMIDWINAGFGQFCANRGYGERFIRYCEWFRQIFVDDKQAIATSLGHQALILKNKGQLDQALNLHQQEQVIYEELGDKAGLGRTYGNQAVILADKGQLDQALELHQQQQAIYEELDDKAGLSKSYCGQALILKHKGQLDEALALHQQEQVICKELGDKDGLSRSYGNQALILKNKGQLDEAMVLLQQQQAIKEELGDKGGLAISLANQSLIYEKWQELEKAVELCQRAIALRQECGMPTAQWEALMVRYQEQLNTK